MTDAQALSEFARSRSPQAMAALVRRYAGLVHATARRVLSGDAHLADDVTQATFVVLAAKAHRLDARALPGWLVTTARLSARAAVRAKLCRDKHETRAATMRSVTTPTNDEPTADDLLPLLDDALARLNDADRSAVVMRFFRGLSFAEVASATGSTEEAARKRVARAVEKLRAAFLRQGMAPGTGALTVVLAAQQARDVSGLLVDSIIRHAVAGGAGNGAILAKGALKAMTTAKIKFAAAVLAAVTLTGGAGAVAIRHALAADPAPTVASDPAPTVAATRPGPAQGLLKNGVSVTVLGVSSVPTGPKTWWHADGPPLADPPYAASGATPFGGAKAGVDREFALRYQTKLADGTTASLRGRAPASFNGQSLQPFVDQDPTLTAWAATMDVGKAPAATLHWDVAAGPWKRVARAVFAVVGSPGATSGSGTAGDVEYHYTVMGDPKAGLFVSLTLTNPTDELRVRAVLADGKEDVHYGSVENTIKGVRQAVYRIVPPTAGNVRELIFESRPFDQWVEVRNISLVAGARTDVNVVTSDDPGTPAASADGGGPPAAAAGQAAADRALERSPFTDVRWEGDAPRVLVDGTWYELVSLDAWPAAEILAAARGADEKSWKKRFAEDLVAVLSAGGRAPGDRVRLELRTPDGRAVTFPAAAMTRENRQAIVKARIEATNP